MTCVNTLTLEPASPTPRMTREMEVDYVYENLVLRCEMEGIPPPALSEVMGMPEMVSIWANSPSSPPSRSPPPPSPRENVFKRILDLCLMSDSLRRTNFQFQGVFILGALGLTLTDIISLE
jgi:hypothetical protein